ncbi:MAG: family acetyltransferase [Ramlibacter sp.]|nr:family acetyltransferase [Ramlibacter sp.]
MATASVSFRVAEPADAVCVAALATQVFLDTYAADGLRPDLAREAFSVYSPSAFDTRLRNGSNHFVLAQRTGHLVAFSECSRASAPPLPELRGGMELVRLYVQPRAQRHGLGGALLARAEKHAATAGHPMLWLTAWTGNSNARAFYEAQGYQDVGTTTYAFEGKAYENRIYRKMLSSAS